MNETTITGASDDLIELDGAIREEFNGGGDEGDILAFSDGTLLEVLYDSDGIWRIKRLASGACKFEMMQTGDVAADTFDIAKLTGDIAWVVKSERGQYSPLIVKR